MTSSSLGACFTIVSEIPVFAGFAAVSACAGREAIGMNRQDFHARIAARQSRWLYRGRRCNPLSRGPKTTQVKRAARWGCQANLSAHGFERQREDLNAWRLMRFSLWYLDLEPYLCPFRLLSLDGGLSPGPPPLAARTAGAIPDVPIIPFPSTIGWNVEHRASMPSSRGEVAAALVQGRIHVVGAYADGSISMRPTIRLGPVAIACPLPRGVHHTSAASIGGRLYVVGGYEHVDESASDFRVCLRPEASINGPRSLHWPPLEVLLGWWQWVTVCTP